MSSDGLGDAELWHILKKVDLVTREVEAGKRWSMQSLEDQDALLDASEDMHHFPFGLLLWESAIALARYTAGHAGQVCGKTVLELGCGAGLPGMAAAEAGAQVCQSDHLPAALALARRNALNNSMPPIAQFLADWQQWPRRERCQIVMGADLIYDRTLHHDLWRVLQRSVLPGGEVWLTDPQRLTLPEFLALKPGAWQLETVLLPTQSLPDAVSESRIVEVKLMRFIVPLS